MDQFDISGYEAHSNTVKPSGNGAHVLVPKDWRGAEATVVRTTDPIDDTPRKAMHPWESDLPHMATFGRTGVGTSHSVNCRALRWWEEETDRTLIFVDSSDERAEIIDQFDGNRVPLTEFSALNPFAIAPPAGEQAGRQPESHYDSLVTTATTVLDYLAAGSSVDESDIPESLVRHTIEITLQDAGIQRDDAKSFRTASPTLADYLDTWDDIRANPDEFRSFHPSSTSFERTETAMREVVADRDGASDPDEIDIEPGDLVHVDLTDLPTRGREHPATLAVLFSRLSQFIATTPSKTLVVVDSLPTVVRTTLLTEHLSQTLRHWRNRDASCWLVLSNPADLTTSSGESLGQSFGTLELFGLSPDTLADAPQQFGLTDEHTSYLQSVSPAMEEGQDGLVRSLETSQWESFEFESTALEDRLLVGGSE